MPKLNCLKKLTAISFLVVLVFNFYGYRLLINYLQKGSSASIEADVDASQYDRADLVSIKTRLHLPYYSGSASYERVSGSVNIDGTYYEYVERRVYNDTLEILVLPNHQKTRMEEAGTDLAKSSSDEGGGSSQKKGGPVKLSIPDFLIQARDPVVHYFNTIRSSYVSTGSRFSSSDFSSLPERPPQPLRIPV